MERAATGDAQGDWEAEDKQEREWVVILVG